VSTVYFTPQLDQIDKLFDAAGFDKIIAENDSVALKIHFGEPGNQAYLKPDRVKPIVKKVRALGGKPFWTDANTLYHGKRCDDATHLQTAHNHGYTLNRTGAEVIISAGAPNAQAMLVLTHFKGHELTGFGGALKNVGMGCASRAEKLEQHSDCEHCAARPACRKKEKLESCWVGSSAVVQGKMVSYAASVIRHFTGKIAYINFICDVSENCDCYPSNSAPIVPDLGILASFDPVALDQACVDMVNNTDGRIKGKDKLKTLWPDADWEVQLKNAEGLGLGKRNYEITNA
jgi:uncharacterized Fe-S center protein